MVDILVFCDCFLLSSRPQALYASGGEFRSLVVAPVDISELASPLKRCNQDTCRNLDEREHGALILHTWPPTRQTIALIGRHFLLNIRTSTTGCIRVIGVVVSRTAREEPWEESGQRTLEHRKTGTYDCGVGLDGRPNS